MQQSFIFVNIRNGRSINHWLLSILLFILTHILQQYSLCVVVINIKQLVALWRPLAIQWHGVTTHHYGHGQTGRSAICIYQKHYFGLHQEFKTVINIMYIDDYFYKGKSDLKPFLNNWFISASSFQRVALLNQCGFICFP